MLLPLSLYIWGQVTRGENSSTAAVNVKIEAAQECVHFTLRAAYGLEGNKGCRHCYQR